jgi:multidrug efflux pump subunit AcrA (membrane-fusion protein)
MASEGLVPNQQLIDARFALRQASLEVERLDKERALETVQSPIDGVVTARHVQPGESVAVGAPLFDVADVGALELSLRLPRAAPAPARRRPARRDLPRRPRRGGGRPGQRRAHRPPPSTHAAAP